MRVVPCVVATMALVSVVYWSWYVQMLRSKGKFQNIWENICWKIIWSKPDNLTIILGVHKHQWSCKYHWRSHFIFNEVQYLPIQRNQFAVKFLRYNCFWLVLWDYMSIIWKTSDQRGSSFYCNGKKTCNFLLSRCIILIFNL